MADLNLDITKLTLSFLEGGGHEHRVRPISRRTVALLQELIDQRFAALGVRGSLQIEQLRVPPLSIDLQLSGDEQVARQLADAIYGALARQLEA